MGFSGDVESVGQEPLGVDEHLHSEELLAAFNALSADDKMKLLAIEKRYLGGTGRQVGELFREALCRALLGQRRCPRGVPAMAFLVKTMQSVASHDRDEQRRFTSLDEQVEGREQLKVSPEAFHSQERSPEEYLLANEEDKEAEALSVLASIESHFQGDDEVRLMLLGWSEGLRGEELREFVGVDQTRIDYLGKKIRRAGLKLYPNGFLP